MYRALLPLVVTPAKAGVHVGGGTALGLLDIVRAPPWIPAFAGMTVFLSGHGDTFSSSEVWS